MLSVLTLTRNRSNHLKNLLEGLARSSHLPDECIVIHMNEPTESLGDWPFPCHHHTYNSEQNIALPLPKARNAAAQHSTGDTLLFLDVDCIPGKLMVEEYIKAIEQEPHAITMSRVQYLQEKLDIDWSVEDTEDGLRSLSKPHPMRDISPGGPLIAESNYGWFWSLSFALKRSLFNQLGGFSDCYPSYGAEDTDFAWKARAEGVPLLWVPDAIAYHQWHVSGVPPWHNFESIVYNAKVFFERWGEWPMERWLKVFAEEGYINWTLAGDTVKVLKRPAKARPLVMSA